MRMSSSQAWSPWVPELGDVVQYDEYSQQLMVVDVTYPHGWFGHPWVLLHSHSGTVGPISIQGFQKVYMKELRSEQLDK